MVTQKIAVLPDRLERFLSPEFHLRSGAGSGINGEADVCLMQAVGWLAGEPGFSDSPDCACPVLRAYCVRLNDSDLFADQRDMLKPFGPRIVGTRGGPAIEQRRALIACDRCVRVIAPILIRAAGREEWAAKLASLDPITGITSATAAKLAAKRIRAAARDAAWAAAWDAARAAAWDAASAAAWDAAWDAAWAAATAAPWAAASAAASAAVRTASLECLDAMISIR
jgi:hypothetical protein